jgi:iron complex transport system permease protein
MRPRPLTGLLILLVLAIGALALRLVVDRPLGGPLGLAWPSAAILPFRINAATAGAVIGASLAVAGMALQCLLRNALASPFTLGLSSGAGVGVMIALYVASTTGVAIPALGGGVLPAVIGSLGTLLLVWGLGYRKGGLDPLSLVLAGVVLSALGGAIIMFLQHLVPHGLRGDLVLWMMGRVPDQPPKAVLWTSAIIAGGGIAACGVMAKGMDAAAFGDDEAYSVGLNLPRLRAMLLVISGLLTAGAVALAGPLAFVGLIAPHAARLLVGSRHAALVLGSALAGIALVVGADLARQVIDLGGGRIPVGVFTAAIGGPAFLWLLRSGRAGLSG